MKKTTLDELHTQAVARQWARWQAGVEEILSFEEGQPLPVLADHAFDCSKMEPMADYRGPWHQVEPTKYPAAIEALLDHAQEFAGQSGEMIVGVGVFKALVEPHIRKKLTRGGTYGKCVEVLDHRLRLSQDVGNHASHWLSRLVDQRDKYPSEWISEWRAGGQVWKRAPALFRVLYPADSPPNMRHVGRHALPEMSAMVENDMTLQRCFKEKRGMVRQQMRCAKNDVRDYLEGYLNCHPIDLDQASKTLNILGWMERQGVAWPRIPHEVDATVWRACELLGQADEQRQIAMTRMRRERLAQLALPVEQDTSRKLRM